MYEARVLEVFQILYEKATLFQQWRPLFWSTINRKPVFEDEMKQEYVPKKGHFIKFQVEGKLINLKYFKQINLKKYKTMGQTII